MNSYGERFYWKIRRRMLIQNKNWLGVICGDTGSGKSYSALALADAICPRGVDVQKNVVFTPVEFLSLLQNPERLKKGDVIIFDEAGVGMSSRQWYSVQNKLLGAVLQTFRHLNVAVIFTVPNLSFVDVQARKLFHSYLEAERIDYENEVAYLRVYDIQHNSRLDKTYYKYPKFKDEYGRLVQVKHIGVRKIADEVAEAYEKRKTAYTKKLNEDAMAELLGKNKKQKPVKPSDEEVIGAVLKDRGRYEREYNGRTFIDKELLRKDFDVTDRDAIRLKRHIDTQHTQ